MNALMNATPNRTMLSREIAELTNKEHRNVKRDCEVMFAELQIDALSFEHIYFDSMNRQQIEYVLTYELVQTLITGYSIKIRHAVIQRLNELEAKQVDPMAALSDPNALRGLLLGYTEKVIALEHQVETLTPKAAALDRISDCTGLFGVREAAKSLKVRQSDLTTLLVNRGWAYRDRRDVLQPSAEKTARGYVTAVMSKPIRQTDGEERVFSQLRITSKGVARLAQILAKGVAA